jgi:hypothetical protein
MERKIFFAGYPHKSRLSVLTLLGVHLRRTLTTEHRSRIDTESAELPTSPQAMREKASENTLPTSNRTWGRNVPVLKRKSQHTKTNVKISGTVRACGATLLIF